MLKAVVPISQVIQSLYAQRDNPENIDAKELITSLTDSLAFLGCANVNLVAKRKDSIRPDLPKNMRGLCDESVEFSAESLFGDDLTGNVKEVNELNKLSGKFEKEFRYPRRGVRGGFGRGRGARRFQRPTPYQKQGQFQNYNKNDKKGPLNKSGPSKA